MFHVLHENNTSWLSKEGLWLNQYYNYTYGKYVMHGNDCSLVYCNQWKWGWVTPLAKAVHRGTVNNYWWKKRDGRRWSHKADMMFIFRLRIKWTQAQFTEPLSNVVRFSPSPPKSISWLWICLLFIILSIQYHIRIFSFCLILDSLMFPQSIELSER